MLARRQTRLAQRAARIAHESAELLKKLRPRGLISKQNMITAFQRNEARRRDERRQMPAFFEWNARVAARVQNQRRNADAFCLRGDIDLV